MILNFSDRIGRSPDPGSGARDVVSCQLDWGESSGTSSAGSKHGVLTAVYDRQKPQERTVR